MTETEQLQKKSAVTPSDADWPKLGAGKLLVISSAPVQVQGDTVRLDGKFLEGMRFYCSLWAGPVECLLSGAPSSIPFAVDCSPADLPFSLRVLSPREKITAGTLMGVDVVLCSGDNHEYLDLADLCARIPTRIYFIIENIMETRLQINRLEPGVSAIRKLWRAFRICHQERLRRTAFRKADGLQANGYPAANVYGAVNANTLLYLDNRITAEILARDTEMGARRDHLMQGGRLRLLHSGRLEPLKGAQDLVPIALRLKRAGLDFELNIFGTGSLETEMRDSIRREGLNDRVFLHGVVDFETELVPFARQKADIFLSCHRQSDPSCTYLETMGCGVAIIGYDNRMWEALCDRSLAGWVSPLGDVNAISALLASLAGKPEEILRRCAAARDFAQAHLFETEFRRRVVHLSRHPD